jgi:hypothetical protein
VTERELAIANSAGQMGARAGQAQAPPIAAAAPAASTALELERVEEEEEAAPAKLTLPVLERLVAAQSHASPAELDAWNYTLLYLRYYADANGNLPRSFNGLLFDVFGSLIDVPRHE